MSAPEHLRVQQAIVKLLYDPRFDVAQAELSAARRAQLQQIDRRALEMDPLRREKLLKALFDELKGSMTIALHETRSFAFLLDFFSSPAFHGAVAGEVPAVLAMADYLERSSIASPALRPLLAIERTLASARRDRRAPLGLAYRPGAPLRLWPGCAPVDTTLGAIAALQTVEKYLFAATLLPALMLCADAPTLQLASYDPTPAPMVVVTLDGLHLQESTPAWNAALFAIANRAPCQDQDAIASLLELELIEATA